MMISIMNVTRKFNRLIAVDDLLLEIKKGELFAFLGPNGAGKTTTIKMIVGLLSPTSGRINIKGIDIEKRPLEAKSLMSYVPDVPFLYDKLTAYEFMHFICGIYGMREREDVEKRIRELLKTFGLFEIKDELIESYSHGLRQRLVFSSALIHDPEILVIDEPMVGLDPESARLVKNILKDLTAGGKTVFMSTHTLSVAEEIADRIGIIHKGHLIALGTQSQLKELTGKQKNNLEEIFLTITRESDY